MIFYVLKRLTPSLVIVDSKMPNQEKSDQEKQKDAGTAGTEGAEAAGTPRG